MHVPGASADTLPVFRFVQDDYYGTGLPCYQVEANLDMAQLAEAAFQAGLSECAIQLLRTVQRGDGEVRQTVLYHYRGPGHHPVIERITSARLARWADEMRARRSA